MNKSLIFVALLCCSFIVISKPVYTADELHDMVLSGTNPETLNSHLVYDSTGVVTFNKCVSTMRKLLSDLGGYPSVIERNSFGVFRAKLWASDGLYELNCVEANDSVIAEQYKAEYK